MRSPLPPRTLHLRLADLEGTAHDTAGGKKVLLKACGKDSSKQFWQFHNEKILKKTAAKFRIGTGQSSSCPPLPPPARRASPTPPTWR